MDEKMQSPTQEFSLQTRFYRQNETITWLSVRAWFMSWKIRGNFHFLSFAMCSRINLEATVKSRCERTGRHFAATLRKKKKGVRLYLYIYIYIYTQNGRSTIYERYYVRCGLNFAEFMLDIKGLQLYHYKSLALEVQWHLNALYRLWSRGSN